MLSAARMWTSFPKAHLTSNGKRSVRGEYSGGLCCLLRIGEWRYLSVWDKYFAISFGSTCSSNDSCSACSTKKRTFLEKRCDEMNIKFYDRVRFTIAACSTPIMRVHTCSTVSRIIQCIYILGYYVGCISSCYSIFLDGGTPIVVQNMQLLFYEITELIWNRKFCQFNISAERCTDDVIYETTCL